jgi:hypothetical protein
LLSLNSSGEKVRNTTQQRYSVLPNGIVVNNSNLDKHDIAAIMSESRSVPLSEMEKLFIEDMHTSIGNAVEILYDIMDISGKEIKNKNPELFNEISEYIDKTNSILMIDTESLGRGYVFELRTENEEKEA